MADGVMNISKGKVGELAQNVNDGLPTAASILRVYLYEGTEADADLLNFDTMAAVDAGTLSEADFTNYTAGGKQIADANVTVTPSDPDDALYVDIDDQTWTAAGNGTNNTLLRLIIGYDVDGVQATSGIVPLTFHDFSVLTDGSDLTAQFAANGFYSATQ